MRPDGTHKRRILRYPTDAEWSADSQLLAFDGDIGNAGDLEIYTIRADGTDLKQLTHNGTTDMNPILVSNRAHDCLQHGALRL